MSMSTVYFAHDRQESPTPRKLALELAGYKVTLFTNGVALLEALARELPDAVVLDVLLEGRNGFEICRTLRSKYQPASLPVVLSTAIYRSRAYRDEAESVGAQQYLLRPCEPEELATAVTALVGERAGKPRDRAA
ncbi:MAG: response regulator [Planctomycetes bacterium]|nr:response regulator [Planctomycetota bacterium]